MRAGKRPCISRVRPPVAMPEPGGPRRAPTLPLRAAVAVEGRCAKCRRAGAAVKSGVALSLVVLSVRIAAALDGSGGGKDDDSKPAVREGSAGAAPGSAGFIV